MTLLAFVILCLGLTISGFIFRNMALMFGAGITWIGLGVYGINSTSLAAAGIDSLVFSLGVVLALVCFVYSYIVVRKPREQRPARKSAEDQIADDIMNLKEKVTRAAGRRRRRYQ